jgi:6-phosphogluconolactonase (cycloisomerase 2 family)
VDSGTGAVYVQTNDGERNEIVAYRRDGDGRLEPAGRVATGGRGSGKAHLPSQGSVVLRDGWILVANAGSDDLSIVATDDGALTLVDRVGSGGSRPTSIAVHGSRAYVLNTAGPPNVAGFAIGEDGRLIRRPDATHSLGADSDPAQIAFSPDGRTLVVTDRASDSIHVLTLDRNGLVKGRATHASLGATPYGFDFRPDGTLVVTEAAGAHIGKASASSYALAGGAELRALAGPVGNTRSEVCWAVVSADGRYAFVTNFGDGTISTYAIGDDGSIELHAPVAATTVDGQPGLRDEALSRDGRFLYALHADSRRVFGWEVAADGALQPIGAVDGLPPTAAGLAAS